MLYVDLEQGGGVCCENSPIENLAGGENFGILSLKELDFLIEIVFLKHRITKKFRLRRAKFVGFTYLVTRAPPTEGKVILRVATHASWLRKIDGFVSRAPQTKGNEICEW